MLKNKTRRRFLQIIGTASLLSPALIKQSLALGTQKDAVFFKWQGVALGGQAEILLPKEKGSEDLARKIQNEISRLEKIFSLYLPASEINLLNSQGELQNPSPELFQVISKAHEISSLTKGAFDITIQPLWLVHSEMPNLTDHKRNKTIQSVQELIDYRNITVSPEHISFKKRGMAITLNGIAQGFITDRIYQLLISHGLTNSLVNVGEIKALGNHPSGREWVVSIKGQEEKMPEKAVNLHAGKAIATSSPTGTILKDGHSHLLQVKNTDALALYKTMSVIADNATTADALSTGLSFIPPQELKNIISTKDNIEIIAHTVTGETIRI
ncbi:FAD:protein FMN transferase [Kiloniella sp.]|uniref:FAD:protein FMN transferase n=1 Tax=Kiloniella sp. TaxID=1938587 RepID=UPI003A937C58